MFGLVYCRTRFFNKITMSKVAVVGRSNCLMRIFWSCYNGAQFSILFAYNIRLFPFTIDFDFIESGWTASDIRKVAPAYSPAPSSPLAQVVAAKQ